MATEFSLMRNKPVTLLALAIAAGLIFSMPVQSAQAAESFINIDLTGYNEADFPYGIECSGTDVYVTIFSQGLLARIDKDSKNVTALLDDPDGSSAGQGFYSIARDGSDNLWINERDNGKVWKFEPDSETWTSVPIVQNFDDPDNPDVDYPETYESRPDLIRIDENPSPRGVVTYSTGMASFGGVVFANGFVWVGLGYQTPFHEDAFTHAGVSNVKFAGLAKIDPSTNAVTRFNFTNATAPTGIEIDGDHLWISDQPEDKIYKFDMTTETIVETVTLPAGSEPRGMDSNASFLFVALNKNTGTNSEIMKIDKGNTTSQTVIDTGAPNTDGGTFTVFVVGNLLLWTDQSRHIGAINLTNDNKTFRTVSFADSNHFGCIVGSEFWWAGQGSSVVGTVPLVEFEDELATADEDESEDETPRGNGGPPSKKGLALGYVFACYYQGDYCERIPELEPEIVDWIKHSNHIKNNPQVLQVFEQ